MALASSVLHKAYASCDESASQHARRGNLTTDEAFPSLSILSEDRNLINSTQWTLQVRDKQVLNVPTIVVSDMRRLLRLEMGVL